ncbi:amidohydrolase [Shouchella miscanthi]|uniref:amidohydrolase n=1 Tax=Shouchella miscanthi TaxID=2598861 RepID=UPI0011A60188|nr:amidohydrolase [Shouchella miscanthi]
MGEWIRNVRMETGFETEGDFIYGSKTLSFDIKVEAGKVAEIQPSGKRDGFNGNGQLLLPSLQEMHCHLDKSKLGVPWQPITPANSIVERFTQEINELDQLDLSLKERARNLINLELANGVTFFRSHIDVHPKVGQRYLEEVQDVLRNYKGKLDYELVAFPQHGMLRSDAYEEVKQALLAGVDLIGGVDPSSLDGDVEKSLSKTFELATMFHVPIDIHVHDRGEHGRKTVKTLLDYTKQSGWQGKVAISHAFGLNDFVEEERAEIFTDLAETGISVVSSVPITGVIPPLEELRSYGVHVRIGCDNVYDSWSPFGTGKVTEKLNRYAEMFRLTKQDTLTHALELITGQPLLIEEGQPWLKEGMDASFILVDSSSTAEFVARQNDVNASFFKGALVYQKEDV